MQNGAMFENMCEYDMTFLFIRIILCEHHAVYEAYGCGTLGHDNVILGLSVIDDVSDTTVFCTGLTIHNDLFPLPNSTCDYYLFDSRVWYIFWSTRIWTTTSFSLISGCSFSLLGLLHLPLPHHLPQPFSSSMTDRAHTVILFSAFDSLSGSLVSA